MRKTQIPDFRHFDQRITYAVGTQSAVLWVPRRASADANSFSSYAAKLLSDIDRNECAENCWETSDMWGNSSVFVKDKQKSGDNTRVNWE